MSGTELFAGEDVRADLDGRVATVALSRPPVNAFRTRTWIELGAALAAVAASEAVNVVLLRSAVDGIFSAGADLKELPADSAANEHRQAVTRAVLGAVAAHPVPVLAVVDGPAYGGACALVAQADVRIASRRARFAIPEINVGRSGGARHLMRHLDQGTVRWMAFTGLPLSAEQAFARGLVTFLADDVGQEAAATAAAISGKSRDALLSAKQAVDLTERMDVATGYAVEQQFSGRMARSPEAATAATTFRDRPAPPLALANDGTAR